MVHVHFMVDRKEIGFDSPPYNENDWKLNENEHRTERYEYIL